MGRVERRMYKRRQKQARIRRWMLLLALVGIGVVLLVRLKSPAVLIAERLGTPSPTPFAAVYDQTVQTREVTLAAETWYAIQTGVFSTEEAALQKAAAYADRGAPGTVVQDGAKWRVFIACYGSEGDAAAVRTRLGENQRVETYLYRWECPELRLRLTGMAGQLDVVEAGLSLMMHSAVQLRDTATLLDASQLTAADAANTVSAIDGQMSLWAATARERFGGQVPEIVAKLVKTAEEWSVRRRALEAAASSATELSAELKGQGMSMFQEVTRLRSSISAAP
ncbi:MAG: SPOR domain-containing protein [Clostridia bacterium]|nr:SPOR domain-containing protein [Clostridia bacterium]